MIFDAALIELNSARNKIEKQLSLGTQRTLAWAKKKLYVKEQLYESRLIFGGGGHYEHPYTTGVKHPFSGLLFSKNITPSTVGMPVPRDLELGDQGIRWMRRLSVAYGLSFVKTDLANFIYPKHLIDFLSSWYYNLIKVILKRGAKMPRITSKGQITIPQDIRDKFGFLPGMEVDVIAEGNKALIVKSRRENKFIKWLGRGKRRPKIEADQMVDEIRGRSDE
jgi:AbrB family looped-hinge helix DNA binding protein